METYAIFRGLYGTGYVKRAIESVLPHVDKVILVWGVVPFAGVNEWEHDGKVYKFPDRFDDLPEMVEAMDDPRVHVVWHHSQNPRNQWTEIVNDIVIPKFGKPDVVMMGHVTHVWTERALAANLEEFGTSRFKWANTWQVETYRQLDYRISEGFRAGVGFWNLEQAHRMPTTGLDFNPAKIPLSRGPMLGGRVHNLRYSQNLNIMFWRHLVVQAYVAQLGDSRPDPKHFEEKLLNWTPETRDIEMALAHKTTVPQAIPYDPSGLPASIKRDYDALAKQISRDAWKGYPKCE